jgi:hypothetical protein
MITADDILSVADAMDHLHIPSSSVDAPAKLPLYVGAAIDVVSFFRGDILSQTYTESYDGGDPAIYLRHTPVLSITTLTEYIGNIVYTLTNQPPGASIDAWGYSLDDPASGRVVRRTASGQAFRFVPGDANVNVTYVTGLPSVPPSVTLAAMMIVKELWEDERGAAPLPLQAQDGFVTVPGVGYAVPIGAIELLEGNGRNPVVA